MRSVKDAFGNEVLVGNVAASPDLVLIKIKEKKGHMASIALTAQRAKLLAEALQSAIHVSEKSQ